MKSSFQANFSLVKFLLIVIFFSWPFQIAYPFLGETYRYLLLISMTMVAVATYISGKFVFRDGFQGAGWQLGKPKHYLLSLLLALFLWLFPSIIERGLGIHQPIREWSTSEFILTFLQSFLITLIPAFSEEFAWRGYLLPRLFDRYSKRRALLLHGLLTWIWHLPVLIFMGWQMNSSSPAISVLVVLLVSLIPTIFHAIVFAYIWHASNSLLVSTVYHSSFDEVRDSLENSIGLGALGQNWQMLALVILGAFILWKVKWKKEEFI